MYATFSTLQQQKSAVFVICGKYALTIIDPFHWTTAFFYPVLFIKICLFDYNMFKISSTVQQQKFLHSERHICPLMSSACAVFLPSAKLVFKKFSHFCLFTT